jgi:hypothetical protein
MPWVLSRRSKPVLANPLEHQCTWATISPGRGATAASEMQTKKTSKRALMVFLLLVVVCFSRRILGRFPALYQFAGFACLFGFSAFISLSSSGVIWGKCRMNKTRRQVFSGVCASLKAGMPLKRTPF